MPLTGCIQLTACSQKPQRTDRIRLPDAKASQLEEAYKQHSKEKLLQFFNSWSTNSSVISEQDLSQLTNRNKEAYGVFAAFYKPHKLDSLGGSEWGNDIYQKANFLLVQNSIKIRAEDKEAIVDSIVDFRPSVKVPGKYCIYLTPKRAEVLKAFLGDKHLPIGAGGIMNPARSSGESEKRKNFLENNIKIWYGHWGGYWQLDSYPVVYSIVFSKNMLQARVSFQIVYEGGEALLKKLDGKWQLVSSRRTWIE